MNSISIKWHNTSYSKLKNEDEAYFYAFSKNDSLLYIGVAYYQPLVKEIEQNLRSFDLEKEKIDFWIGKISYLSNSKVSKKMIFSSEALLIYSHKPIYNKQCVNNYNVYTHYEDLIVRSSDCKFLHSFVKIENERLTMRK
jgi:hypothetical protein